MSNNETTKQPHEPKLTCAKGHPIEWNRVYRNRVYRCLECGDFLDVDASPTPSSAARVREETTKYLITITSEIEVGANDESQAKELVLRHYGLRIGECQRLVTQKVELSTPSSASTPDPVCGICGGSGYKTSACDCTAAPHPPQTTNFFTTTPLPSCHVCSEQMIGLCSKCGARTDPQPGEPPAQGIGGHYSCVICGMAMTDPCEHWRGLAMNAALDLNAQTGTDPQPSAEQGPHRLTRFDDFDDPQHPANKWWEEHGQYMMAGGGRREFIWACRGWIAREQLMCGVDVTGDSLKEEHPKSQSTPVTVEQELIAKLEKWIEESKHKEHCSFREWQCSQPGCAETHSTPCDCGKDALLSEVAAYRKEKR